MNKKKISKTTLGVVALFLAHPAYAQAPDYRFDSDWPQQPLPNNWWMQSVMGLDVDHEDTIWVLNRPSGIASNQDYAQLDPPTGVCCVAPPTIIAFDTEGRVVDSWDTDPGVWPRLHGLAVDSEGYVWIGSQTVHKYTRQGQPVGSIARVPEDAAPQGGYPPDTEAVVDQIEDVRIDEEAREVYFVDNYLNGRVMIHDSDTLQFKRGWGAYGKPLSEISMDASSQTYSPTDPPARDFLGHVTLAISNDGLVYVADRRGNRIQVFTKTGEMLNEFTLARETLQRGSAGGLVLSADAEQRHLLIPDFQNNTVWVMNREDGEVIGRVSGAGGNGGRFHGLHMADVDSLGNLYTGEVFASRVQRFLLTNSN